MYVSVFRITVTNPGATVAPADGFIDPIKTQQYLSNLEAPPGDFTYGLSQAKRRANLRYLAMVQQMALVANATVDPSTILTPGGSYKTEPTSITVTVLVEAGIDALITLDESNPGQTLTGVDALKRCVARALIADPTIETDVFDPTPTPSPGNTKAVPRFGMRIAKIEVGPVAANLAAASALVSITTVI